MKGERMQILEQEKEFPIITLPKDPKIVSNLVKKLAEYRERLARKAHIDGYKSPEQICKIYGTIYNSTAGNKYKIYDTIYKIKILETLIKEARVDTNEILKELQAEDEPIDILYFKNACGVISEYCDPDLDLNQNF